MWNKNIEGCATMTTSSLGHPLVSWVLCLHGMFLWQHILCYDDPCPSAFSLKLYVTERLKKQCSYVIFVFLNYCLCNAFQNQSLKRKFYNSCFNKNKNSLALFIYDLLLLFFYYLFFFLYTTIQKDCLKETETFTLLKTSV